MTVAARPHSPRSPAPEWRRRGGAVVLLAIYCWIAAIFPVLHATAEQPAAAVIASGESSTPLPLPSGHDHLTCHFCATAGTLVSPPSIVAVNLPAWVVTPSPVASVPHVSPVLAWSHHAIPPRAPPLA